MILNCPECSTSYLTKEDAIGPNGRTVRCAKCEATWFVAAEMDELTLKDNQLEAIVPAAQQTSSVPDLSAPGEGVANPLFGGVGADVEHRDKVEGERRRRRLRSVALIWIIPLLVLIFAAILGYVFRQNIVKKVPAAATFYKSFGIKVKTSGLDIEKPVTRSALVNGEPILVINSAVRNISSMPQNVPYVEFSLHSKSGTPVVTWLVDVKKDSLAKKERIAFVSEYPNPPIDAVTLRYKFAAETAIFPEDTTLTPEVDDGPAPVENLTNLQEN